MIRGAAMIDLGRRVVAKRASVVSREEEGGGGRLFSSCSKGAPALSCLTK